MNEIKNFLYKEIDRLRNLGELSFTRYSDISSLETIGNNLGKDHLKTILTNQELIQTATSPVIKIPDWIIDFIEKIIEKPEAKKFLDPWINRNSFLVKSLQKDFQSYCINSQERELLLQGFLLDENKITLGEPLDLVSQEKKKFDIIISFPPFAMRSKSQESISKDYSTDLLIESSKNLNKGGKLIFLMPGKFVFDKKIKKSLKDYGLNVNALFYIPEGSHSPTTSIPSYLTIVTKSATKKTFLAQLSSNNSTNEIISKNFKKGKEGKTTSLGSFVSLENFTSYKAFEKGEDVLKMGKRTGIEPTTFDNIADFKTIKNINPEKLEHSNNSIYLPRIGNSNVVENPSEFNLKPHNYIQVIIKRQVNSTYLTKYLNTSLGKLTIDSRKVGTSIENVSISSLKEAPLFIPSYKNQISLLEVNNKIENISLAVSELKLELWEKPQLLNKIDKEISAFEKDNSIEKWLDNLPFPISSILWKYYATNDEKDKTEYLLDFFEAFSEFLSLLMLSALYQNTEFYESKKFMWISKDEKYKDWIKNADFGGWNNLTANLAKATRTLLNEKENKDIVLSLFGNPSNEFMEFITSKKNIPILENAREFRNDVSHKRVKTKDDFKNLLTALEDLLNKLRSEVKDSFNNCKIIVADYGRYKNGIHRYIAKELVGIRIPFNEVEVESLIPLDENKLYFIHKNQDKPIELLPFLKYDQESKACYFYNSIESNDIRFVSFHYEQNAQFTELLDGKFEEVLAILRQKEK